MVDAKESLMALGILAGFLLIFAMFVWLPGIIMRDGMAHQFGNGDNAVMFDKDGSLKESFWSTETMKDLWNLPAEQRENAMNKPDPIKFGEWKASPFTVVGRSNVQEIDQGLE